MKTSQLIILAVVITTVQGMCSQSIVDKIANSWNGNPPKDIIPHLIERVVRLTSPSFVQSPQDVTCYMTFADDDKTQAGDVIIHKNFTIHYIKRYNLTEIAPGVLHIINENPADDELFYVVYLGENVMSYYQCQVREYDSDAGFAGILIRTWNTSESLSSPATRDELYEANRKLQDLSLQTLTILGTSECERDD